MNAMDKLNRPAPKFQEGDWAYDNIKGHNAKIVAVTWDKSLYGYRGGWRYAVPGLSDPDMYRENPDRPYAIFEQVGPNCHKLISIGEKP